MVTLHTDTKLIDLAARLPFAFAADYLIGPGWDQFHWPSLHALDHNDSSPPTSAIHPTNSSGRAVLDFSVAAGSRCLFAAGAAICWMFIKFLPSTQMILLAVWIEALCMYTLTVCLSVAAIFVSVPAALALTVLITLIHSFMLTNLRHLRLLELMGLPVAVLDGAHRVNSIGEGFCTYAWPKVCLLIIAYHSVLDYTDYIRYGLAGFLILTSLPSAWLVCDGLRWRLFGARHVLSARSNGDVRLSVVSPYYVTFDAFVWPSVNEDMVNKSYAVVWLGRVVYGMGELAYRTGLQSVAAGTPAVLIQASTASWLANFGVCWIAASVYHWILTVWLKCVGVTFTATEEREHALMKYDMSGFLAALCFMANMTAPEAGLTVTHVLRVLAFFGLAKLPVIPMYTGLSAQRNAVVSLGSFIATSRTIIDGSVVSVGLGCVLLDQVWKAPLNTEQLFAGTWLGDRSSLLTTDYEIWMHGEVALCTMDLLLTAGCTVINTVASHAHLVAQQTPRFWHYILKKTDCIKKLWTLVFRELLAVTMHTVVLSLLWDNRLDGVIITAIYLSRLLSNIEILHNTAVEGITTQFFCLSKCIIKALPSPTEEVYAAWSDKCSICQLEEPERLELCIFPCSHFFHRECIEEWLKQRMCCPLCMRKIWFENGEVKIDK